MNNAQNTGMKNMLWVPVLINFQPYPVLLAFIFQVELSSANQTFSKPNLWFGEHQFRKLDLFWTKTKFWSKEIFGRKIFLG